MHKTKFIALLLGLFAIVAFSSCCSKAAPKSAQVVPENDNSDFVMITDVVPDAILEIRYYSTYNFVGTRIDGYLAPVALLTRRAADSLRAVSDEVKAFFDEALPPPDVYGNILETDFYMDTEQYSDHAGWPDCCRCFR